MQSRKNIKILQVIRSAEGITETFIWNEIGYLVEQGYDVTVLCDKWIKEEGDRGNRSKIKILQYKSVDLRKVRLLIDLVSACVRMLFNRLLWKTIKRMLRSPKVMIQDIIRISAFANDESYLFDVVHVQFSSLLPEVYSLIELGRINPGQIFCSVRGYDIAVDQERDRLCQFIKSKNPPVVWLPVCEYFADKLYEIGVSRTAINVKYSAVNLALFQFREKTRYSEQPLKILFCGRLVDKKGIFTLIDALAIIIDNHSLSIALGIVGDGPARTRVMEEINRLGLAESVTLHGVLEHTSVIKLMQESNLLVMPSQRAADGDMEGIPNVIKEAMAVGTPVIASDHSGIPELIQDGVNGFIFPEADSASLAAKIMQFSVAPDDVLARLCAVARRDIEDKFDRNLLGEQLVRYYELRKTDESKQ